MRSPDLVEAVSAAAGIALENGRLEAELRARLQELHGSRTRVVEAQQNERRRLERDLHDGAQQRLVALALELGMLAEQSDTDPATQSRLKRARSEVSESLNELRDVARGLHPAVVSGHGLAVALESLATVTPLEVELKTDGLPRLPEQLEVACVLRGVGKSDQCGKTRPGQPGLGRAESRRRHVGRGNHR